MELLNERGRFLALFAAVATARELPEGIQVAGLSFARVPQDNEKRLKLLRGVCRRSLPVGAIWLADDQCAGYAAFSIIFDAFVTRKERRLEMLRALVDMSFNEKRAILIADAFE